MAMAQSIAMVNGIFPLYLGFAEGFDPIAIPENFAYVLDASGWKLFKRNEVSVALIPVEAVSGLTQLLTSIQFTAAKLPLDLIRKVTAWFRAVYQRHKSEAVGYLYYRSQEDGSWDFVPPAQTASAASAHYDQAPRRAGWTIAGTIHSHGSMSAFHSRKDQHDEECFDGVHITIGRVDSVPEYSCSLVVQGKREIVDPAVLIDGIAPLDSVPTEWMEAVKESAPTDLDESFKARAETLYARYYAGEVHEFAYKAELAKIKEEAEAARKATSEKFLASASYPASAAAPTARFETEHTAKRLEEGPGWLERNRLSVLSFRKKKGGKHGGR